jgi:hypothetical protein
MIRAVLVKDIILLSRDAGWRVVLLAYLVVLSALCLLSYSDLVTAAGDVGVGRQTFWEHLQTGQWVLLTVLTPWVMSRFGRRLWDDDLARLLALAALRPQHALLSLMLVSILYLCQLLLVSLPYMAIAERVGAATAGAIVWAYADLGVWLLCVQWCTLCWNVWVSHGLLALLCSYASLGGLAVGQAYLTTSGGQVPGRLIMLGCVGGLGVLGQCCWHARFRYMRG